MGGGGGWNWVALGVRQVDFDEFVLLFRDLVHGLLLFLLVRMAIFLLKQSCCIETRARF